MLGLYSARVALDSAFEVLDGVPKAVEEIESCGLGLVVRLELMVLMGCPPTPISSLGVTI